VASSAQQFRLVYELDVSFASLRRPTQRPKQEVRLKVADVLRLPFADGSLSAVVSEYLLNRLPDPVGAATEIRRVLKSGGIWVNLSRRLRPVARPGVLESLGLAVARCEPLQFASADSCRKDAEDRRVQEVQFFVARKVLGHTAILVAGWPASYGWWQWIVRAVQAGRMRMACRRKCGA
jgi:ubiquinone/menaquinone biosynthesis C-methylase UbiE